jgi:hypothetical protein
VPKQEQGEEGLSLAGAEAWQRLAVHMHRERAEEADDKRRNGRIGRGHAGG